MSQSTNLARPYLAASQSQKHVTVNESLRFIDALVQISVKSATLSAPPGVPADGQRWIIGPAPTGLWAGRATQIAAWQDGAWVFYAPKDGWLAWNEATLSSLIFSAGSWISLIGALLAAGVSDTAFTLTDDADPTKKANFELSGITTGTTRTFSLPNTTSELAILAGTQTFTGNKTFSGTLTASGPVTVSSAAASIGTATTTAIYGVGTGATTTGVTKTVNLGTGGAAGSTTVVNIGSATAGAGGTTVVNTPTVTFTNAVTQVGMPQANLTAQLLGLGGATADATNRLSANTPNVLLNNAGASIDVTVNKNAAANDASFSFKTGFSARALFGTLGSDDFTLKVSPDGSAFFDALIADRATGRVRFPVGVALSGLGADPGSPADGWLWHNSATGQLKARLNGVTRIIDAGNIPFNAPLTGDFVPTTMGSGSATGTLAGAADRVDLFPFIPRGDLTIDRLSVNVTAAVAAALGKIVVYAADEAGRPTTLLLETATLDFSVVAAPAATVSLTLRKGVTYWFGIRHSSTATLSAWPATATPDLTANSISVQPRKLLRRIVTFATGAPSSWTYVSTEVTAAAAAVATAIWLRST